MASSGGELTTGVRMMKRYMTMAAAIVLAGSVAGCANDGGLLANTLTTASVPEQPKVAAGPKVDPQCFALMSKIEQMRKEGTPARIEKVATTGKGSTASVKRESLAKLTELDKANAEFQARCSNLALQQAAAPIAAQAPAVAVTAPAAVQPITVAKQTVSKAKKATQ